MVVDAEVKMNNEDHSSVWMERSARKRVDRADIARDFWLSEGVQFIERLDTGPG